MDLTDLEKFMTRARTAARTGTNEIRIPASEALSLVAAIGYVLAQNANLKEKLGETKALIGSTIQMDGGGFKS